MLEVQQTYSLMLDDCWSFAEGNSVMEFIVSHLEDSCCDEMEFLDSLKSIFEHGCISGCFAPTIYTKDCNELFDLWYEDHVCPLWEDPYTFGFLNHEIPLKVCVVWYLVEITSMELFEYLEGGY